MKVLKGINVVSISVSDLNEARQFYRDVLGLGEPIYDLPDAGWIEFGSGSKSGNIALTKAEAGWKPSTGTTVLFNVEDCNVACTELRRRGVRCEDPVVFPGYVTFCSFYDPFWESPADVQPSTRRTDRTAMTRIIAQQVAAADARQRQARLSAFVRRREVDSGNGRRCLTRCPRAR